MPRLPRKISTLMGKIATGTVNVWGDDSLDDKILWRHCCWGMRVLAYVELAFDNGPQRTGLTIAFKKDMNPFRRYPGLF
ncbi:Enoyl-CoA hydratase [Fusarium oxysporum f. sp. albedinis]|nr:Enoyl-CoA hydratase [Fusarium oxysporum f. sp. albedinis]